MKLGTPLGFIIGFAVIYFGIKSGVKNSAVLINWHAAIIVFGGTLAAVLVCFPLRQFLMLFKVFFYTLFSKADRETLETINEIVALARSYNEGRSLEELLGGIQNPFLKESVDLVAQEGLSDVELEEVLEKRVEIQNERYRREALTYKIIGKFPPAFGLIGTSLGMIALLQGLGQPNSFDGLGSAMSIALVATFYGLVLANLVIIPIGENLAQASEHDLTMRRIVVDGVRLIKERKHPLLVEEYLKSYMPPFERNKLKKAA